MYIICTYHNYPHFSLSLSQTRTTPWHALYMATHVRTGCSSHINSKHAKTQPLSNSQKNFSRTYKDAEYCRMTQVMDFVWTLYCLFLLSFMYFCFCFFTSLLFPAWNLGRCEREARCTVHYPSPGAGKGCKGFRVGSTMKQPSLQLKSLKSELHIIFAQANLDQSCIS